MDGGIPTIEPAKTPRPKTRTIIAIIGMALLVGIGFFSYLVVQNLAKIRRGELDVSQYQAADRLTSSGAAATQVKQVSRAEVETADDPSIGSSDAAVTIVEFSDFECPFCQESVATVKSLLAKYGKDLRVIHRDFPVSSIHANAFSAAIAAKCAADQGKFWQFHDLLFINQESIGNQAYDAFAAQSGINLDAFSDCRNSTNASAEVTDDYEAGLRFGVRGTPTWFVNGYRIEGAIPYDQFERLIALLLKGR